MRERQRGPEERGPERRRHEPPEGHEDIERIRDEAEDLLGAADEAIDRALSADSRAFLRANRQQGGQ